MYSLSDFFHTWMDLAGIRFSGFDPGKSIISPLYTHGPVLIGNPAKPEALVDVRQKFFPTAATTLPGPEVLRSSTPGYGPEYGVVTGTVPVRDRWMLHP